MQETRNNNFGSKIRSTALCQAKTDKHECQNITATYCYISALVLSCFRLTKGRATYFRPEIIVASFLHLMVLLFKVLLIDSDYCKKIVIHTNSITKVSDIAL